MTPKTETRDLLVCPFCSAPALLEKHKAAPVLAPLWHVRCGGEHCHVAPRTGDENSEEYAIAAWNRRSPTLDVHDPASDEVVEAVVRAQQWAEDDFDRDHPDEGESFEDWTKRHKVAIARAAIEAYRKATANG